MEAEKGTNRVKRPHVARRRIPLAVRIYFWGAVALGLVLAVSSVSAWFLADQQTYDLIGRETGSVLDSFEIELNQDTQALELFGKWLNSPGNTAVLETYLSSPEGAKSIEMLRQTEDFDFFIVTDGRGRVVARADSSTIGKPSNDLSGTPHIVDALAGRTTLQTEVDASGQLAVKLVIPRYASQDGVSRDSAPGTAVGAVVLGFYVDEDYIKDIRKKSGFDNSLVIISKDQLAASMLAGRGGNPQIVQFGASGVNLNERGFPTGHLVTLMTNRGPYLYSFRNLSTASGSDSIVVGSGVPAAVLDSEHQNWLWRFGLWLLVGVLDLGVVGFFVTRSLTRPLKDLSGAVQQIQNGNLSNRIAIRRGDELGDLAAQLENMRLELATKLNRLASEKNGASAAIRALAVPVVITDWQNRILVANRAAEALMGFSNADLTGRAWHTLFSQPEGADSKSLSVWETGDHHIPSESRSMMARGRLTLASGSQPVLDISSVPIHVDDQLVGYVHTLQDVSEIDRFAKAKNEFLLSVAHELEGPLASWRASVDLLVEDYGELTRSELGLMLRTLQKTAVRFQGLVDGLVDVGKLEAGKFRVRPAPTLYEKMVQDSIGQIEPSLQVKGQRLQVNMAAPPTSQVMADRRRINQVIINLLRNASKYSPEGETITVETSRADGQVFFRVTDRGKGIDPAEQELIFERYYRSKRVEEEGAGIGLGLALAKAIVEAHGGRIGVSSEPGRGSTFWFSLSEINDVKSKSGAGGVNESSSSRR